MKDICKAVLKGLAAVLIGVLKAISQGGGNYSSGGDCGSGESVWTVGGGGKKDGSWSSGRHKQR